MIQRQKRRRPLITVLLTVVMLFLFLNPLYSHIDDEISIKTRINVEREEIFFRVEIDAGFMIGPSFLDFLDPDQDKDFAEEHIIDFAEYISSYMEVMVDNKSVGPKIVDWEISPVEDFLSGLCSITLDYTVPFNWNNEDEHILYYENHMEDSIAIYSLHIKSNREEGMIIVLEERNEMLQDSVSLVFMYDSNPLLIEHKEESPDEYKISGITKVIEKIKAGEYSPRMVVILTGMAMFAGFLHAFTPGHGKALVGAYLVANRGTLFHAVVLGLVVTVSHTLSIYIFGGLASTATYFFLPSRVVPFMTLISGIIIVFLGLRSFVRRLLNLEVDHAHLLPNLKILREDSVNILMDGNSADSAEILMIASDDDCVLEELQAVGAEGLNLCSPGCETHKRLPFKLAERQGFQLIKMAIETGAVDAVVTKSQERKIQIRKIFSEQEIEVYSLPHEITDARNLLLNGINNYKVRGEVLIPGDSFSWKKLISLGFAGGIVPCPDALAILLISISIGQFILGMGIVLSFSIGLSIALVLIGIVIVFSKNMLSRKRWFSGVSAFIPYFSSLFITLLGSYMIVKLI